MEAKLGVDTRARFRLSRGRFQNGSNFLLLSLFLQGSYKAMNI